MVALYLVFLVFLQIAYCSGPPSRRLPCGSALTSHRNWRLLDTSDICGISGSSAESRILGGRSAKEGEFPWLAIIVGSENGAPDVECGGAIINKRYILTAAHCIDDALRYVRVGGFDAMDVSDCYGTNCRAMNIAIESVILHPRLNLIEKQNDIALIRLTKNIPFDDHKSPICLPTSCKLVNKNFKGTKLLVAGWGQNDQDDGKGYDGVLRKVEVVASSLKDCKERYDRYTQDLKNPNSKICTWGNKPGGGVQGPFKRDSGSPLVYRDSGVKGDVVRHFAIGVVAHGGPQIDSNWQKNYLYFPTAYMRVAYYMPWILNTIRE